MAMLDNLNGMRPTTLHGIAQAMQRADPRIATPRKDQPPGDAHSDHLIEQQIGGHANERQVLPPLANDLVASRVRNQVREAFQSHTVTIANMAFNSFTEREKLHTSASS